MTVVILHPIRYLGKSGRTRRFGAWSLRDDAIREKWAIISDIVGGAASVFL